MSSGTRAVSVVPVGITHHGWRDPQLQKSTPEQTVIPSEVEESRCKPTANFAGSFDFSRVRGIRSG